MHYNKYIDKISEVCMKYKYRYINNFTGEVYKSLPHAISTIIKDAIHYKNCRNIKMLNIKRHNS